MERLTVLGLNPNESACLILYLVSTIWILYLIALPLYLKLGLVAVEILLVVGLSATQSRGAAVVLLCTGLCAYRLPKGVGAEGKQSTSRWLNLIFYNPIWRLVLLLCNPGLWSRTVPTYVVHDASIYNRFELWKGALKLLSSAPWHGWGYKNTGAAYMNWFQAVDNYTFYNGLVNSYLQIGAGYGLMALCGILILLFLAVMNAVTLARGNSAAGLLCLLVLLVWAVSSLFSSMLASPLLFFPPLVAVLSAIIGNVRNLRQRHVVQTASPVFSRFNDGQHPALRKHWLTAPIFQNPVFYSAASSVVVCLLLFLSGRALVRGDSLSIRPHHNGAISITNGLANSKNSCAIYVDEEAIGRHYGKELRKFLLKTGIGKCIVISRSDQMAATESLARQSNMILLSGITVSHVDFKKGASKYVLLHPAFVPRSMPCESIQSIVWPEIDRSYRLHCLDFNLNKECQSKVRVVPFNEVFETSWSKFINI